MGLKIAKRRGAALVVGSSTNPTRRERLAEFGADLAIDSSDPAWPDQVLEATDGEGLHLTVDMVSGALVNPTMRATRVLGRMVNVGRLGGTSGDFDFNLHAAKRIDYIGVTFRTRTIEEVREIARRMKADLWDDIASGALNLPIDRIFPLDDAVAAHAHMRANAHFGKIVLAMPA
jgi:NADPH2:quinone reductase